tara:strand:+ start:4267 stop:5889 length:1623 start_codon:yes stop_codon:yes gene_type:complete
MESIARKGGENASRPIQKWQAKKGLPRAKRWPGGQGEAQVNRFQIIWESASRNPIRFLLLWVAAIVGLRLSFVVAYTLINGGFLGVDEGAYILGVQALTDSNPWASGIHFTRAPLSPGWLLWPFLQVFGLVWGSNLYSFAASLPAIGGFYLLARAIFSTKWAVATTMLFSFDWVQAELLVTGTAPLMGMTWMMVLVAGMLRNDTRWGRLAIVIAMPLIAYTNQTSLALSVVTVPLVWLMLPDKRRLMLWLAVGAALTLTALPWYWEVVPGTGRMSYPGAFIYLNPAWSAHWHFMVAGVVLGGVALLKGSPPRLRALAAAMTAHAVLQIFLSHDEAFMNLFFRSTAWMMPLWWIVAAWTVKQHGLTVYRRVVRQLGFADRPNWAMLRVSFVALLAFGLFGVAMQYKGQAYYSELAGGPMLDAIAQIDLDHAEVIGTNAESRGYYIAAVTKRTVVWTQSALPATAYVEKEAALRCEIGWIENCERLGHITHFLIDEHNRQIDAAQAIYRSPDPANPWDFSNMPWMVEVYRQGSIVLYELEPA